MRVLLLVFLMSGGALLLPEMATAQAVQSGLVTCQGIDCNACSLVAMVNNIINWIIGFMVVAAVILFVIAGFGMVTSAGDPGALQKAKNTFFNVVIGFILVLAAWLIIDTIMQGLTGKGLNALGPVTCGGMVEPRETAMDQMLPGESPDGPDDTLAPGGPRLTASEAREILEADGIGIKDGIGLDGVRPHVLQRVTELNRACKCSVLVTEATGGTHAAGKYSHENGFKLDLRTRDNPDLVNYIRNLPTAGSWRDGTKLYYDATSCGTYAVESDHVDVVYKPSC